METSENEALPDTTDIIMADQSDATTSSSGSPTLPGDPSTGLHTTSIIQVDESASDVSMSTDSDEEDEKESSPSADGKPTEPVPEVIPIPKKRKYSNAYEEMPNGHDVTRDLEGHKRLKPDEDSQGLQTSAGHLLQDRSLLPPEIWQCIFTYTPPRTLGSLLRVNKAFNAYLDPSSDKSFSAMFPSSAAQIIKPDAIWRASRRLFRPQMPLPLADHTELDMWRLGCHASCQLCGKKRTQNTPQLDPWHPGPGEDGVSSIWAFAVRSCGACLQQRTMKVGHFINPLRHS